MRKLRFMPLSLSPSLSCAVALALASLAGCASVPLLRPSDPVAAALDDKSRPYVVLGRAEVTVVLQSGLGDDKSVWKQVMPKLTHDHAVIALDRPGRGSLAPATTSRDPCSIASEERAMLQAAGVQPPYLLVGHSLGGLYQFVYAKLYPEDVAGLLLVDPTPLGHWETLQKEVPHAVALLKVMRAVAFSPADRAEFDAQQECLDRLDLQTPLSLPAKVLVAGRFRPEEKGTFETVMKRSRKQWIALVGVPDLQVISDSGHFIQKDRPEAVLAAVQEISMAIEAKKKERERHAAR